MTQSISKHKEPSLLQAFIPIIVLIGLLIASVQLYGDGSSGGPNQIALILCAGVAILVGLKNGYTWKEMEEGMVKGIGLAMGAIFILLVVGSLIGTWMLSGVVPTMIYYGLQILHPSIFYLAACLICALVALATGSSWSTAGTVGIALIGIATALNLNVGIAAGAVISGSYFGDKLSPLSDTTNLAPAMAGTDLFTHIRHMLWTTVPSLIIACILFTLIGFLGSTSQADVNLDEFLQGLDSTFNIQWYLLLLPVGVIYMVMKKVPAFPALLIGALAGGVFAILFQQEATLKFAGNPDGGFVTLIKGFWTSLFDGYAAETGNDQLDYLLKRGGMSNMLSTIWLIISAMMFGAVMEKTRMLEVIARGILDLARSTGSLVAATLATSIGMNIIASDQYIAIVIPGRMYRAEFHKRRLHPKNLSRCLEDSGTLTSVLVPWNTCGAYMAGTLGVATGAYWYYCFFNLMNPVISAFYGFTGISMAKMTEEEAIELQEVN
ncbi:MAG: Na+/H+ antiporter NhaC [Acidobacteriota bacterium]|nr:Na+/H+ antiporter NhaC [Acidobacteriota bacterium]